MNKREGSQPKEVRDELVNDEGIVLTTDSELLAKLRNKLKEYEEGRGVRYVAPEVDPHGVYKMEILRMLLKKGNVAAREQLRADFKARYGQLFNNDAFNNAYGVIEAYNSGDAEKLVGGTGLK